MLGAVKQRAYEVLWVQAEEDVQARRINLAIAVLIIANVTLVILESVETIRIPYSQFFRIVEVFSVAVFTVEYVLRLWSCKLSPKFKGHLDGQIHFVTSPMGIVDLFAIVPFYLGPLFPYDLRFLRALRLVRLLRVLKLARYSRALQAVGNVIGVAREELVVTGFVGSLVLVMTGGGLYFAERDAQPEVFSSIPASMWSCLRVVAKLGAGEVFPVTPWGKGLAAITGVLGIAILALPTGILTSAFIQHVRAQREKKEVSQLVCPPCGKEYGKDVGLSGN